MQYHAPYESSGCGLTPLFIARPTSTSYAKGNRKKHIKKNNLVRMNEVIPQLNAATTYPPSQLPDKYFRRSEA